MLSTNIYLNREIFSSVPQPLKLDEIEDGTIYKIRFSLEGKPLATILSDDQVKVIDLQSKKTLVDFSVKGMVEKGGLAEFTPDLKFLVTAIGNKVDLWDVGRKRHIKLLGDKIINRFSEDRPLSIALSPDGKVLVSLDGGIMKLWDIMTTQELMTFRSEGITSVAFSPDGKILAASNGKIVKLYFAAIDEDITRQRNK